MQKVRYKHLNSYLKDKFGERTLKVCVDAGFTCPNRDGTVSCGGCIFCGEMGAGENIKYRKQEILDSIKSQVTGFLNSYRGERANKFIVYFQSFTNTYAPNDELKLKYDTALSCSNKIVGIEVATRPDCINREVAQLLATYKDKYYVCVELGFQTASDEVGKVINRGYTTEDFERAVKLLHVYNIDVVAHVMIGLPNETSVDIKNTINCINDLKCEGIKLHSTYVLTGTKLEELYKNGEYESITQDYYVNRVVEIISNLNDDVVIHRINADPPKSMLVAPEWTTHKKIVLNSIERRICELDINQGDNKLTFGQLG